MYLNMYTIALQRDATFLRALQRKNPLPLHCKAMRRVIARKRSNLWHVFPAGLNSVSGLQTHTPNYARHSLLRFLAMTRRVALLAMTVLRPARGLPNPILHLLIHLPDPFLQPNRGFPA